MMRLRLRLRLRLMLRPMLRLVRPPATHPVTVALVALIAVGTSGCAAGLLHRGGPAVTTVATGERSAREQARAEKATRRAAERAAQQAAKQAARDAALAAEPERHGRTPRPPQHATVDATTKTAGTPHDPLGEARAHMQQNPSEPFWPYRIAQLQSAAGFAPQAEDALRTAIARDSAYVPALTELSRMLYDQGRYDEGVKLLAPVREHRVPMPAADRAAVLSGLALHEAARGRDDAARATLDELAHDERDDAVGASAWLAVRGSENATALTLTEKAVSAAPKSAANHNNRGIALLRAADPDAAAREFERAIELDPSRPGPYYNLAILERWYRLDHAAAAKRFQQYWTRSHSDPDSLYAELGRAGSPVPVAEEGPNR